MRTISITIAILAMALVVTLNPKQEYKPRTVWEHYCKYNLHIHPSQATEDQYIYFLDAYSGSDEYQDLYTYYETQYPEYNRIPKHYGNP